MSDKPLLNRNISSTLLDLFDKMSYQFFDHFAVV